MGVKLGVNIFCFIIEQIVCIWGAGVAGYVKLQRQTRCDKKIKYVRKQYHTIVIMYIL